MKSLAYTLLVLINALTVAQAANKLTKSEPQEAEIVSVEEVVTKDDVPADKTEDSQTN